MRPMKSFGVRLGIGLVTIVFGAYAAVLAQKDNQDSSRSWTAEAPTLDEPAAPIAESGEQAQPIENSSDALAQAAYSLDGSASASAAPVELVQHAEVGAADPIQFA